MAKRTRAVTVRFTDAEYDALKKKSADCGLKMEPFIRNLISEVPVKPKPTEGYILLRKEVSAIGNNINQIAYIANLSKQVSDERITQTQQYLHQIWELLLERM